MCIVCFFFFFVCVCVCVCVCVFAHNYNFYRAVLDDANFVNCDIISRSRLRCSTCAAIKSYLSFNAFLSSYVSIPGKGSESG